MPDVLGEGERCGGDGLQDEAEEEEEAQQSRGGAQLQEKCSGEQTECYVNTLV